MITEQHSKKNKLLDRFENDNTSVKKDFKKHVDQIKINRQWASGKPPEGSVVTDGEALAGEESQKMITNLIYSTIQGLLPHYYAKAPDISARPHRQVMPIDGDETEESQYEENRMLSETIEIVVQRQMLDAKIKKKGKKVVRSAMTARLGFIKTGYYRTERDNPVTAQQMESAMADMERLNAMIDTIENDNGDTAELEAEKEEVAVLAQSLEAQQKVIVDEGITLDVIPFENMRWDPSVDADCIDEGRWIAQFMYETLNNAKAEYELAEDEDEIKDRIKGWTRYHADSSNSDEYKRTDGNANDGTEYVRVWERWDANTNSVYTWVEGDSEWVREPDSSMLPIKGRWYPYFGLGLQWMDGQKMPLSTVETIIPLQQEYDELRKQLKEHRRAALPYILADSSKLDAETFQTRVKSVGSRDIVFVDGDGSRLSDMFAPGPSVNLNPALYDASHILSDLQWVTGLQDAQRGGITKAKTLGEAELLESGFNDRTEEARDEIEEFLTDIYMYCTGLCLRHMTVEEVHKIAGNHATWPVAEDNREFFIENMNVEIEAGSTGRPNRNQEMRTWFENVESLIMLINRIQEMRQTGVLDKENPYYRIMEITLKRLDERMDVMTILPKQQQTLIDQIMQEVMQTGIVNEETIQQLPAIQQYLESKQQLTQNNEAA